MSVEIKELDVRAELRDEHTDAAGNAFDVERLRREILEACREEIDRAFRRRMER
ncbi:MAG: DUF5908 family protein [Paracoccaceae bacterium]|nr:DUF5908 family protein [Paracoccaceae bacterium]